MFEALGSTHSRAKVLEIVEGRKVYRAERSSMTLTLLSVYHTVPYYIIQYNNVTIIPYGIADKCHSVP